MKKEFCILPLDYREQKSREQAAFKAAARLDPSLIREGQIFKDVCRDHVVRILCDPYMADQDVPVAR